jgi:hypothetical protein
MSKMLFAVALAAGIFTATAVAQESTVRSDVQIYRAAPGHQRQLLQFLEQQEQAAKAAGLPASQLYVHQSGANWDYVLISPHNTDAQDKAVEAASVRMGIATGPKMGLQFREHVAEHTDTIAAGPYTVAEWLKRIDK